jgi:hypothetical protein
MVKGKAPTKIKLIHVLRWIAQISFAPRQSI